MRLIILKGGTGSGDFGHSGRPGEVGGSSGKRGRRDPGMATVGRLARSNTVDHVDDNKWKSTRAEFQRAIEGGLSKDLVLKVGKPYREGSWITQQFLVETKDGRGYASAVLWYSRVMKHIKVQQDDMSLPSGLRGKGIGGDMIRALMAGYKALGVGNIPIHVNTNPSFWSHMNKKYPGMYYEKQSVLSFKGGKGSGHHSHRGRHGRRGGSTPGKGHSVREQKPKQLSFMPEKRKKIEEPRMEFSDKDIPDGWTKFAHDAIVRNAVGGTKKAFIIKYDEHRYSVQRRYLGNALDREVRKLSPEFRTLNGAVQKAERWLEREKI